MRKSLAVRALSLLLVLSVAWAHPVGAEDDTKVRKRDLSALLAHLGKECKLLKEKKIDWRRVSSRAKKSLKEVESDADFYGLLVWVVGQLHDTHAGVQPRDDTVSKAWRAQAPKRQHVPMALMPGAHGQVIVSFVGESLKKRGIEVGMVLRTIDGEDAGVWVGARARERFLEGYYSTMHRALMQTYGVGIDLPRAQKTRLELRALALSDEEKEAYLRRSQRSRGKSLEKSGTWRKHDVDVQVAEFQPARYLGHGFPPWYVEDLKPAGAITHYATLPSGLGYVRLRNIHDDQPTDLATVFESLTDCPGLIVDLRWNGGGGGEKQVAACFPGTGKDEDRSRWTRPVAVLIGPRVMSSGDSVAHFLRAWYRHELFGSHTSGASGPKKSFELPSGFARVRYVFTHWKSRRLEGIGVPPTKPVLQDVVELSLGVDSVRAAAERHLLDEVR